ncbi:MAG: hypothetical protein R3C11_22390 [Planctomycetaceae bacterium]
MQTAFLKSCEQNRACSLKPAVPRQTVLYSFSLVTTDHRCQFGIRLCDVDCSTGTCHTDVFDAAERSFQNLSQRDTAIRWKSWAKQAGIEGEFGTSQTIYYCDQWRREDGKTWEMNLALLFDEEGALYNTMPGRTQITTAAE